MVDVSVIVVNYGTADLAIDAVESVLSAARAGHDVDVHLVDNASPGNDADTLRRAHRDKGWAERVVFYPESVNHGFGRGNNVALRALAARETPPDYVFLLNPDARLENDAIAILADTLDRHPRLAIAGAAICDAEGDLTSAAFRFPSIMGEFVQALNFGPVSRAFRSVIVPYAPEDTPADVDWVSGAAFMARFSALRDVGYFDPDFFLYFEEVELMHRIRKAGWEIRHVPEALVRHVEGAATDARETRLQSRRRPAYWYDSWRLYFLKTHGRFKALCAALAWLFGTLGHRIISTVRRKPAAIPAHFYRDVGRLVFRPLLTGRPGAGNG